MCGVCGNSVSVPAGLLGHANQPEVVQTAHGLPPSVTHSKKENLTIGGVLGTVVSILAIGFVLYLVHLLYLWLLRFSYSAPR